MNRNFFVIALLTASCGLCGAQTVTDLRQSFTTPPPDARVMMRWWWFGGAVTDPELEREIKAMKAGGIGGFEIQPVYPMALDNPQTGFRNLPYLSDDFLHAVTFANRTAQREHMRLDMTLASGWPYGGPHVPITQASGALRVVPVAIAAGAHSVAVPALENGEKLIAAFAGASDAKKIDAANMKLLTLPTGPRIDVSASDTAALFFISSRTGQQVKRPEIGAEGYVLDHYDRAAIDNHLRTVGDKLMQAFGDRPPYSVFSDSLEVYAADWTPDLLDQFKKRRGYDLTPHLAELYSGTSVNSASVRHDWGKTLTELVDENYLTPINDWATAHHTQFRSQTYGLPPVSLSSNRLVALPEGEGPQWRRFSFTRWATSAGHLFDRPVISAETWTWLHSPAFRATPLDMKAEADLFFLEGINQLIGHGWPYTPPEVAEPGWSFYAAAVFNDHNPWWGAMPDVMSYLQRVSYLLRQGSPANDVAIYVPTDDAWSNFRPGLATITGEMPKFITPALTAAVLDAGHNLDYIDADAIANTAKLQNYHVLILPHITRMDPATLRRIADYTQHGGKVIFVGDMPSSGPGLQHTSEDAALLKTLSQTLFGTTNKSVAHVATDDLLSAALTAATTPDMQLSAPLPEVGFIHRRLPDSEVYFVVNTSNHSVRTSASFGAKKKFAEVWNPQDGTAHTASADGVPLDLAPYESRVVVFSDRPGASAAAPAASATEIADISKSWYVQFKGDAQPRPMDTLQSWTTDPAKQFYSGEVTYTKDVTLTDSQLAKAISIDFGEGTPVNDTEGRQQGTRALLDSPVREVAIITVNGVRAGSVWCPPYRLDITSQLHAGTNHLEIRVGNTAMNTLAGRALPNYRLLNLRYGERFTPQDAQRIAVLPSGILGPVKLMGAPR